MKCNIQGSSSVSASVILSFAVFEEVMLSFAFLKKINIETPRKFTFDNRSLKAESVHRLQTITIVCTVTAKILYTCYMHVQYILATLPAMALQSLFLV